MSFANSIGHTFTGVVGHHGRVHLPRPRTAVPASAPERHHRVAAADTEIADRRHELEQWRTAFLLAVGLNR